MKVAHLADIHVKDQRRDEYAEVFQALIDQLTESRPDAIAIAGDVFDTMTRASPANWDDVASLLHNLGTLAPVVVIPGNHDLNERKRGTKANLLAPLFRSAGGARGLDPERVCLWDTPGLHTHPQLPDVLWVIGAPAEPLPDVSELESADLSTVKTIIALFHETISGCRYPNGQIAETDRLTPAYMRELAEAVAPHHLAIMLGDVHLLQEVHVGAPNSRCFYPGSLVCQNFGEPHLGHGWLEWRIPEHDPTAADAIMAIEAIAREVPNPRAMYTARVEKGVDVTLEPRPELPSMWRLSVDETTSDEQLSRIVQALTARHGGRHPREVLRATKQMPMRSAVETPLLHEIDVAMARSSISEANKERLDPMSEKAYLQQWLDLHSAKPELAQSVMSAHLAACQQYQAPTASRPRLTRLEFSNLYCYGEANTADFTAMAAGPPGLVGLTAPNASGKSALLDIIYMAMTGEVLRGHKARITREGADYYELNLEFELDGQKGRVTAWRKANRPVLTLEFAGEELTGKTVTETAQLLRRFFGSPKHISRISLYRPGRDCDFMHLSPAEQDGLIMELLALGHHKDIKRTLDTRFTEIRADIRAASNMLCDALPGVATTMNTTKDKQTQALIAHIEDAESRVAQVKQQGAEYRAHADAADSALAKLNDQEAQATEILRQIEPHNLHASGEIAKGKGGEGPKVTAEELPTVLREFAELSAAARASPPSNDANDTALPALSVEEATSQLEDAEKNHSAALSRVAIAEAECDRLGTEQQPMPTVHNVDMLKELASKAQGTSTEYLRAQCDAMAGLDNSTTGMKTLSQAKADLAQAEENLSAAAKEVRAYELKLAAAALPAAARDILSKTPEVFKGSNATLENLSLSSFEVTRKYRYRDLFELERELVTRDPHVTEEMCDDQHIKAERLRKVASELTARAAQLSACGSTTFDPTAEPPEIPHETSSPPPLTVAQIKQILPPIDELKAAVKVKPPPVPSADLERQYSSQRTHRAVATVGSEIESLAATPGCAGCSQVRSYIARARETAPSSEITTADIARAQEQERQYARRAELTAKLVQMQEAQAYEARQTARAGRERWIAAKVECEKIAQVVQESVEATQQAERAEADLNALKRSIIQREGANQVKMELSALATEIARVDKIVCEETAAHACYTAAQTALESAKAMSERALAADKLEALRNQLEAEAARETLELLAAVAKRRQTRLDVEKAKEAYTEAQHEFTRAEAKAAREKYRETTTRYHALAARLTTTVAHARHILEETQVTRPPLEELARSWSEKLQQLNDQWRVMKRALACLPAKNRIRSAQLELAVVTLHRQALDPIKGVAPMVLEHVRAHFLRALNTRLSSASAPFRVLHMQDGYELRSATDSTAPLCRDPALSSGYQSFVLELSCRAALEEAARVPLPAVLVIDEGFGCLDGSNLPAVAESLRCVATDARPGRPPPLVLAVTHRDDLRPAFAQHYTLDYTAGYPTRLTWGGAAQHLTAGRAPAASASDSPMWVDSRCTACDKPVSPGQANWAAHVATSGHAAWTDPGLQGHRRAAHLHCLLCALDIVNGKNSWTSHVATKRHRKALGR